MYTPVAHDEDKQNHAHEFMDRNDSVNNDQSDPQVAHVVTNDKKCTKGRYRAAVRSTAVLKS